MKFTYLTLSLFVPSLVFGMELEKTNSKKAVSAHKPAHVILDLEDLDLKDANNATDSSTSKLSADLVKHIKAGKVSHINQLLTKRTNRSGNTQVGVATNVDQLVSALGYTQGELELQQSQMAQKMFDSFMTRYKQAAIPLFLTAFSIVNIGTNAYTFANPTDPAAQQSVSSFGINMAATGSAALGFGWASYLQLRKGWTDHRQKKLVEQLKNSRLLLELLHQNALKDGVVTPQEQAVIDAAQTEEAKLQVEVAQATIDAQNAAREADANSNNGLAAAAGTSSPAHDNNQPARTGDTELN